MRINFKNCYGEMELEGRIRSIFDSNIAGQVAEDGKYYCIHVDHKTHTMYALSKETEVETQAMGYHLEEDGEAIFNGEKVRAMTYAEECTYNEDRLTACVDLWGNIAVVKNDDGTYTGIV